MEKKDKDRIIEQCTNRKHCDGCRYYEDCHRVSLDESPHAWNDQEWEKLDQIQALKKFGLIREVKG